MTCPTCKKDDAQYAHYDDPVCADCVEVGIDRHQKRQEWRTYHEEPCPESELPQFENEQPVKETIDADG